MAIAQRRAIVVGVATALAAAMAVWAPPAHAACTTVPASTPGTTVRIAGEDHRVPAVSNVSVCTSGSSVPFVWVETSGGSCSAGCLAIGLTGSDADPGSVTISYRLDGTTTSRTVSPGGAGGGEDSCLLSVGAPQAPHPDCFNAVNVDDLPVDDVEQLVDDAEQAVAELQEDLGDDLGNLEETACDAVPNAGAWGDIEFCENPQAWVGAVAGDLEQTACDTVPDTGEWGQADFCTDPQDWATTLLREALMPIRDIVEDLPTLQEILEDLLPAVQCGPLLEPVC